MFKINSKRILILLALTAVLRGNTRRDLTGQKLQEEENDLRRLTKARPLFNEIRAPQKAQESSHNSANNNHAYAGGYHPLKLEVVYHQGEYESLSQTHKDLYDQLVLDVVPSLQKTIAEIFRVAEKPESKFSSGCKYISDSMGAITYDADFVLYLRTWDQPGGRRAWSYICKVDQHTKRPRSGILHINPSRFFVSPNPKDNLDVLLRYMFWFMGHEIRFAKHSVLGFRDPLNQYALVPEEKIFKQVNGKYYITAENVVQRAKDHFDCDLIMSIPFENSQTAYFKNGAMWETSYVGNAVMSSEESKGRRVITPLTLAFLEASGWYRVDSRRVGQWTYGYKAGCDFLTKRDTQNPYSCNEEGKLSCYPDTYSLAYCQSDHFFAWAGKAYTQVNFIGSDC